MSRGRDSAVEALEKLSEDNRIVVYTVWKGAEDVHDITQATYMDNGKVNGQLKTLKNRGLVELEERDGMVEKITNGRRQKFNAPKGVELTDLGERVGDLIEDDDRLERFRDMSRGELIEHVLVLEDRVDDLEERFEEFETQVRTWLFDRGEESE